MSEKISIILKATPEQIAEIKQLQKLQKSLLSKRKLYSPFAEYILNNYGAEISDALFEIHKDDPI